jgi:hypothetical protein
MAINTAFWYLSVEMIVGAIDESLPATFSIVLAALDLMVVLDIYLFFSNICATSLSFLNFSKSSTFILHCSNSKGSTLDSLY